MTSEPTTINFDEKPYLLIWEVTQACDLSCLHCRACAQPKRHPLELSTDEGKRLIDEVAEMQVPVFVLTGGDPIKRPDLFGLIEHAARRGVRVSLTPSATPLLSREIIHRLKNSGLARLALSLDGSHAQVHDAFRGMSGSFDRTMEATEWANEVGLPVQINTTFSRSNMEDFDSIAGLLETKRIALWSVFFLVPTGRGKVENLLSAQEFEAIFAKLYRLSQRACFDIKTTEAQHYRRYVLQQRAADRKTGSVEAQSGAAKVHDTIGRAPRGLNDGKGFVFISHTGEVMPSGFLPVSGGNVRRSSVRQIYQNSVLFQRLRNPDGLGGKCGACEFRHICGGSRARAYALTGDAMAEEPCCSYVPKGYLDPAARVQIAAKNCFVDAASEQIKTPTRAELKCERAGSKLKASPDAEPGSYLFRAH
ncbi:MAG TPA: TIGR04053 family radical SAM/SPASM domain-containing protein [Terriglobales bacterium]|nr:TIGR04053 family radical SAM/SPASM domain-containing protein [Terriglobales bacterium]